MASTSAQDSNTETETHSHQLCTTQGKSESNKEELSTATKGSARLVPAARSSIDES